MIRQTCLLVSLFLLLPGIELPAQKTNTDSIHSIPIGISVFNNATHLPFSTLFPTPIHPGVCLSRYLYYGDDELQNGMYQTFNVGYFYHRYAQHALQLYSEIGYRITPGWTKIGIEAQLGLGYLHAFPDIGSFTLNKDGTYIQEQNFGRSQLMGGLSLGITYDPAIKGLKHMRLFLHYQGWLQYPFVNEYIPILPNTAFHLGGIYYFKR